MSNRSLSNITVVLDMCFTHLKNETNNAHKHILITTRYCRGHTPPWIPIDLLSSSLYPYQPHETQKFHTNSYLHIPFLYRSLYFDFVVLSLNDRALYLLKLEYVEPFFIMRNNTRAFRYSKIEDLNKGEKVKSSFF